MVRNRKTNQCLIVLFFPDSSLEVEYYWWKTQQNLVQENYATSEFGPSTYKCNEAIKEVSYWELLIHTITFGVALSKR